MFLISSGYDEILPLYAHPAKIFGYPWKTDYWPLVEKSLVCFKAH